MVRRRLARVFVALVAASMATSASGTDSKTTTSAADLTGVDAPVSVSLPDVPRRPVPGRVVPAAEGAAVVPVNAPPPGAPAPPAAPTTSEVGARTTAPPPGGDIPALALAAYRAAAAQLRASDPTCGLDWSVLAGIARVESNHGRYGGATLGADGVSRPLIIGIALDGRPGVARILDTDAGALDGDTTFDRAVGPMQFLPGTWARWGADGDGDGRIDPHNINDAALAAARYLCAQGSRLIDLPTSQAALLRYNHSVAYGLRVLGLAEGYRDGATVAPAGAVPRGGVPSVGAPPAETPSSERPTIVPASGFVPAPAPIVMPEPAGPPAPAAAPEPSTPATAASPIANPTRPSAPPTAEPAPKPAPKPAGQPAPAPAPAPTPSPAPAPNPSPAPAPTPAPAPAPAPEPATCQVAPAAPAPGSADERTDPPPASAGAPRPAAAPVPAGSPAPAGASTTPSTFSCDPAAYAAHLAKAANDARASVGLPPLIDSPCADAAALKRVTDLVRVEKLPRAPSDEAIAGCEPSPIGAELFTRGDAEPSAVIAGWLAAASEHAPLLNPTRTQFGVGCVLDGKELRCSFLLLGVDAPGT